MKVQKFYHYQCILDQLFNHVRLVTTTWIIACQAPLSTGLSQQEYWSGLSFSPPEGSSSPNDQTPVSCV